MVPRIQCETGSRDVLWPRLTLPHTLSCPSLTLPSKSAYCGPQESGLRALNVPHVDRAEGKFVVRSCLKTLEDQTESDHR